MVWHSEIICGWLNKVCLKINRVETFAPGVLEFVLVAARLSAQAKASASDAARRSQTPPHAVA